MIIFKEKMHFYKYLKSFIININLKGYTIFNNFITSKLTSKIFLKQSFNIIKNIFNSI